MTHRSTGWLFVVAQAALLITLVVVPSGNLWPRPPWLLAIAGVLTLGGMAIIVLATVQLGPALTPTPEPRPTATLRTDGLYRTVRHPIYSGVLVIVVGLVVRNGGAISLVLGIVTVGFFNVKAGWEERRLAMRYPDYAGYAALTPRFVPRPRRKR